MKKETVVGKIEYMLFCDGTKCKQCSDAFRCRLFRGLNEKDIQDICDNTEMKMMRALPQNMREIAAILKKELRVKNRWNKEEENND